MSDGTATIPVRVAPPRTPAGSQPQHAPPEEIKYYFIRRPVGDGDLCRDYAARAVFHPAAAISRYPNITPPSCR
jgi:hypothetical protein